MIRNIFITVVMSAYLFDESTGALKFKKITGQSAAGGGWGVVTRSGKNNFPMDSCASAYRDATTKNVLWWNSDFKVFCLVW